MLNPIDGKYEINQKAAQWMCQEADNYFYQIIDQKEAKSFISPTTSKKRGKKAAFGTQSRLSTWIETKHLSKIN